MINACEHSGVQLGIGFKLRFEGVFKRTKELLDRGMIGDPFFAYFSRPQAFPGRWYGEVRCIRDSAVHEIDLAYWFLQEEPVSVFAKLQRLLDIRLDDRVCLLTEHEGKKFSVVQGSWSVGFPKIAGIHDALFHIIGDRGFIVGKRPHTLLICNSEEPEHVPIEPGKPFQLELGALVDTVTRGIKPPVKREDGLRALRVVFAAYESITDGEPVLISSLTQRSL